MAPAPGESVAIIMRSKNEQPYAERTLEALQTQTVQNYVLYNVDSGSTDGTLEAVKKYNPRPELVTEAAPERIIVLLNADCVPQDEYWLERLLVPLYRGEADGVTSRQVARPDAHLMVKYDLDRVYGPANTGKTGHSFFSAAACAFKRALWEGQKFPEEGWGEDFVWAVACKASGARFAIAVESVVEHSHNYTLKTLYRRERGHGMVYFQVLGEKPSLVREGVACARHMVRDVLYALRHGRPDTIPFNVAYRAVFNYAHFSGRSAASKNQGFPQEFFRN
jgi:rhamnosyltransferase